MLGVEWVLPSGDLVRMESLGLRDADRADWFTADGPGPSLRGIMRGFMGALGGLGVFTRVAIKLYSYPCDSKWEISGYSPDYAFAVPDFMQYHIVDYGSYEKMGEGFRRIEEEEICFMCFHTSAYGLGAIFSHKIGDFMKSIPPTLLVKHPLVIMITGRTRREFEYKERVLEAVNTLDAFNPLLRLLAKYIMRIRPGYFRLLSDFTVLVTRDGNTSTETGTTLHEIVIFKKVEG